MDLHRQTDFPNSFAGILSSIESNDTKKPSRERRGSSPPWTWMKQLPTPTDKTKFIGKRSLRKRTHKEMAVGIPPSKLCLLSSR